jgi:HD superfamily phosphohydrolase
MAYLVYPGANHTRFEHSLGVSFLAKRYFELRDEKPDEELVLAALLHDIGHGPFSHESEHLFESKGISHEGLSVAKVTKGEIAEVISRHGLSPKKVGSYLTGAGKGIMIAGALGIDRIDYLMRDSYYAGTVHGKIDYERLLDTVELQGNHLVLGTKGIEVAESLALARFMMFTTVYQHKTVGIAAAMLRKAIENGYKDRVFTLDEFTEMVDYECLMRLKESRRAAPIVERLLNRNLYKPAVFMRGYEIPDKLKSQIEVHSFLEKFEKEICSSCGISHDEIISHYTFGNYKPIHVRVEGAKERELSEISDVVSSIRDASDKKRLFFVAVPENKRAKVRKAALSLINSHF